MWFLLGVVAANKSIVRKTVIWAFLEYFGVLEVGFVGESHGVNPFPHISALAASRVGKEGLVKFETG